MRLLANYLLRVKGQETTALIDTRVDRDFISKDFVKQNRLWQKQKTNPYLLNTINKIPYRNQIIQETKLLEIEIEERIIKVKFDIVLISKNIILGDN